MALEPITRQEKIIAGQDLTPITRMEKFLKQYGGGSGGVTSWNDLTDKPFGEVTTVKEVLAECQPEFDADTFGGFLIVAAPVIEIGQKYIVTLNGAEYNATAFNASGMNENPDYTWMLVNDGADMSTGEGVAFGVFGWYSGEGTNGYSAVVRTADGSTELTISIRQEVTEVKKISGKYVEGMGYEEDGVVHPIDPKFLPSGGGGAVYYADEIGALFHDSSFTTPVSFEEARDAVDIIIRMVLDSETIDFYPAFKHVIPGHESVQFHCLDYNDSGNPVFKQYSAGVTAG